MMSKEMEQLLKDFDELLPWEKQELAAHMVWHHYSKQDLMDDYGFTDEVREPDSPRELVDMFDADDILDELWPRDIIDYITYKFCDDLLEEVSDSDLLLEVMSRFEPKELFNKLSKEPDYNDKLKEYFLSDPDFMRTEEEWKQMEKDFEKK